MALDAFLAFGCQHVRVVVQTLAGQNFPVIVALWFSFQVRLAIDRSGVTSFLKQFRKRLLIPVKRISIVHETILVTVHARLDYCATGATNRIRTKTVLEYDPLRRECIDVRTVNVVGPVTAKLRP